jgi:hypothetical protein
MGRSRWTRCRASARGRQLLICDQSPFTGLVLRRSAQGAGSNVRSATPHVPGEFAVVDKLRPRGLGGCMRSARGGISRNCGWESTMASMRYRAVAEGARSLRKEFPERTPLLRALQPLAPEFVCKAAPRGADDDASGLGGCAARACGDVAVGVQREDGFHGFEPADSRALLTGRPGFRRREKRGHQGVRQPDGHHAPGLRDSQLTAVR